MGDRSDKQYEHGLVNHEWKRAEQPKDYENALVLSAPDREVCEAFKSIRTRYTRFLDVNDVMKMVNISLVSDEDSPPKVRLERKDEVHKDTFTPASKAMGELVGNHIRKSYVKRDGKSKTLYDIPIAKFVKILRAASAVSDVRTRLVNTLDSEVNVLVSGNTTDKTHVEIKKIIDALATEIDGHYRTGHPETMQDLIAALPEDVGTLVKDYLSRNIGTELGGQERK